VQSIEQIIRDAASKYNLDGNRLLAMANCESTLNPNSVNYNYSENGIDYPSGLFQHLTNYWGSRATQYGYDGYSVFNAIANAQVTAAMIADGQSYQWECKY